MVFSVLENKKIINYNFITWFTTLIISLLILASFGVLKSSSVLEFKPLWFVHSMIESLDKFYLPRLASYRSSLSQNLSFINYLSFSLLKVLLFLFFFLAIWVCVVLVLFLFFKNLKVVLSIN
jgi:hypothetical protein